MPSKTIQWFPGHMAKTRRLIKELLPAVDFVIELLDARIPYSSENPEIDKLVGKKPILTMLSKCSLADPEKTAAWKRHYEQKGRKCIFIDTITGYGYRDILPAARELMGEKIEKYENKGMQNRPLRAMVVGIPNSGKSSFINRLAGRKKTKIEDRPGVTREKQWVVTSLGLVLLDMPGVLWPKFEDEQVGLNLAFTGAIKDDVLDVFEIASKLALAVREKYPNYLRERYKLSEEDMNPANAYDLLLNIGRRRGFLLSGGEIDEERTSNILLDEFRAGRIGRITLENA